MINYDLPAAWKRAAKKYRELSHYHYSNSRRLRSLYALASRDLEESTRKDERQRCVDIIQGFADLLKERGQGTPHHALILAIELISDDDEDWQGGHK